MVTLNVTMNCHGTSIYNILLMIREQIHYPNLYSCYMQIDSR
jgi:hypothetical protein